MRHSPRRGWMRALVLATLGAVVWTGCGETPSTPLGPSTPGSFDGALSAPPAKPTSPPATTTRVVVSGSRGGVVQCGRFALNIPAGAFSGTGTITMTLTGNSLDVVDLQIEPASLNQFGRPVRLTYSTSGLSPSGGRYTIFWYNPATGTWVDLNAKTDRTTASVSLQHFSKYRAGKAGW